MLHEAESRAEAGIAAAQGHFGVDSQAAGEVDDGEEQIAKFGLDGGFVAALDLGLQLADFFSDFRKQILPVRPVEAGFGGVGADLAGLSKSGQGASDGVKAGFRAGAAFFSSALISSQLRRTAVDEPWTSASTSSEVSGGAGGFFAKDMRVAADELAVERVEDVGDGEAAVVGGHFRIEEHLEEQVAELFGEVREVAALDGVEDFVGFFQGVFADGFEGLFAVPGAAAGSAEARHDCGGLLKELCRSRGIGVLRRGGSGGLGLWTVCAAGGVHLCLV